MLVVLPVQAPTRDLRRTLSHPPAIHNTFPYHHTSTLKAIHYSNTGVVQPEARLATWQPRQVNLPGPHSLERGPPMARPGGQGLTNARCTDSQRRVSTLHGIHRAFLGRPIKVTHPDLTVARRHAPGYFPRYAVGRDETHRAQYRGGVLRPIHRTGLTDQQPYIHAAGFEASCTSAPTISGCTRLTLTRLGIGLPLPLQG